MGHRLGPLLGNKTKKLETTQFAMLRSILGIRLKDKISKTNIKMKADVEDIGYIDV